MASYPFLLLKRSTVEWLETRATTALAHWAAEWGSLPITVHCVAASDTAWCAAEKEAWQTRELTSDMVVWVHLEPGLTRSLVHPLFNLNEANATSDKHHASDLADSVIEASVEDVQVNVITSLTGYVSHAVTASVPPAYLWRRGSGAVLCTIRLGDKSLSLLLPAVSIPPINTASTTPRAPITLLQHALHQAQVKLCVEVSQAELTLGYLGTLAVGDVLSLPTHLDEPLRVSGPGDTTICQAHLGSLQGYHAIELIKLAS